MKWFEQHTAVAATLAIATFSVAQWSSGQSPATLPAIDQPAATQPASMPSVRTFDSAAAAGDALVAAARADDMADMLRILGPSGANIINSGDGVADEASRTTFVKAFDTHHEISVSDDGNISLLLVGPGNWPMPIPIVKDGAAFRFDAAAGRDEILNRRIGRNEKQTMKTLLAVVDAQTEYAMASTKDNAVPAYAARFASTPGQHDGLYWEAGANDPQSPLGPLFADAAEEGYGNTTRPSTAPAVGPHAPYHGYYYHMLHAQGPAANGGAMDYSVNGRQICGFAAVAWPADYGNSGVMTFIVNQQGVVYQRDLGPNTQAAAKAMKAFDPSTEWTKCDAGK